MPVASFVYGEIINFEVAARDQDWKHSTGHRIVVDVDESRHRCGPSLVLGSIEPV